ncbi:MAG TPA: D-Ala-D-Ala carboxypeptidase family metallohydrolase [Gemmatimonadaceae bacterium]|nr:D-Ala-D-Ala carboxypeptidase family metallohydrolase [Gemmatimonadaceae bacterium]
MSLPEQRQPPRSGERRHNVTGHPARNPVNLATLSFFALAAIGAVHLRYPQQSLAKAPFAPFLGGMAPTVRTSATAFGASGEVRVRFAMPGESLEYPLEVEGDPTHLSYSWVRAGDTVLVSEPRPLVGPDLDVPDRAGFYRLALVTGASQQVLEELSVAVLVPFHAKVGPVLNGYRIGTYVAERFGERKNPEGFLEITASDLDLQVTRHLRVADFVTHDRQQTWPKYAAVSPRLLDKIELVVAEIARWQGRESVSVMVDVKSGFRSPDHNRRVARAASDSRHQYGDAADIAIDADGDGRLTRTDTRLVGLAVEIVEARHPELVGGLGIYLHTRTPYVHIDARGKRVRWRG